MSRTPIRDSYILSKLNKEPVNSECVTRKLSPEELQQVIEKYGPPSKPIQENRKLAQEPKEKKICSVQDCTDVSRTRGFCKSHYGKWRLYGDPTFSKRVN